MTLTDSPVSSCNGGTGPPGAPGAPGPTDSDASSLFEFERGAECVCCRHRAFDAARLLAPLTFEQFRSEFYERRPLIRRGCADHYRDLFRFDEVELAIAAAPYSMEDGRRGAFGIRASKGGGDHYAFEGQGPAGRSNTAPHRAFDEGYTIVADALRHHHPALARLCGSLEQALQHPVGCNLYLTPPAAQGFSAHADNHDTFLLQIEGRKAWRLWRPEQVLPLPETKDHQEPPDGPPDHEVELRPGDLLYIPHGWWHAGVTNPAELSLHITLGTLTLTWADLVVAMVRQFATEDVGLRRSLPLSGVDVPFDQMAAELCSDACTMLSDIASRLPDRPTLGAQVVRTLLQKRLATFPPPFEQRLHDTFTRATLGLRAEVEVREGIRPVVLEVPQGCRIVFVGGFVTGPQHARAAFDFAAHARRFCAEDLPGLLPELQLQLTHEFVLQGLVRPVGRDDDVSR